VLHDTTPTGDRVEDQLSESRLERWAGESRLIPARPPTS
jgi:hypothetical protein